MPPPPPRTWEIYGLHALIGHQYGDSKPARQSNLTVTHVETWNISLPEFIKGSYASHKAKFDGKIISSVEALFMFNPLFYHIKRRFILFIYMWRR